MDYILLINRKIIDVLIGDKKLFGEFGMPYMSGPKLCELSTTFGLPKTYVWGGQNKSRWEYMQDLLKFLNQKGKVSDLLSVLFQQGRFDNLTEIGDIDRVNETYKAIVKAAIDTINAQLMIAKKELRIVHNMFVLANKGEEIAIDTPKINIITSQYIKELPDRIESDLDNNDFDSVVTKSRTLLEEVLIFIVEHLTYNKYESNGNLIKIYQDVTSLMNMRAHAEWDKRVNDLLGGLHKILSAISSMRNINSDAHGAGSSRIQINKREAILIANSAMILAEYWLSIYEGQIKSKLGAR